MKQLVVDAGPLISLFYAKDPQHTECIAGFEQLNIAKTLVLAPVSIIFEVYKWLLQRANPYQAQQALEVMVTELYALPSNREHLLELQTFASRLPTWRGTLEDASVIVAAFQYRCPVWTTNYRDFSAFKALEFWTPDQTF